MRQLCTILFLLFSCTFGFSQSKFHIVFQNNDLKTHYIADEHGSILKKLDSTYWLAYDPETLGYFHVFSIQGEKGWCAVDIQGEILFKVYNTERGSPSPDDIFENRIRIIDDNNNVGFADSLGNIIIKPQFEIASSFENGTAMIGGRCKDVPWGNHSEEGCSHYSTLCEQHGYIDLDGTIVEFGDYTFSEISDKLDRD